MLLIVAVKHFYHGLFGFFLQLMLWNAVRKVSRKCWEQLHRFIPSSEEDNCIVNTLALNSEQISIKLGKMKLQSHSYKVPEIQIWLFCFFSHHLYICKAVALNLHIPNTHYVPISIIFVFNCLFSATFAILYFKSSSDFVHWLLCDLTEISWNPLSWSQYMNLVHKHF